MKALSLAVSSRKPFYLHISFTNISLFTYTIFDAGIPVIIGNGIRLPFDWEMDWRDFSVKIPEWRLKKGELRQILASIPEDRIKMKQNALAKVRASVAYIGDGDPTSQTAFGYLMRELRVSL